MIWELAAASFHFFLPSVIHDCPSTCVLEAITNDALSFFKKMTQSMGLFARCMVAVRLTRPIGSTRTQHTSMTLPTPQNRRKHGGWPCSYLAIMAKASLSSNQNGATRSFFLFFGILHWDTFWENARYDELVSTTAKFVPGRSPTRLVHIRVH